ncbi:MAG TPA: hypothetical protein VFD13_06635, partial [Candidatus Kapabacteria bacterium]|nr:hypothetical protein [Candidatus Kapabacteria bacterium]
MMFLPAAIHFARILAGLQPVVLAGFHPLASFTSSILNFFDQALIQYGYAIVFAAIMIESMGVPFPGETMLLVASAYAASTGALGIFGVIGSAAAGAMIGDSLGYW